MITLSGMDNYNIRSNTKQDYSSDNLINLYLNTQTLVIIPLPSPA